MEADVQTVQDLDLTIFQWGGERSKKSGSYKSGSPLRFFYTLNTGFESNTTHNETRDVALAPPKSLCMIAQIGRASCRERV